MARNESAARVAEGLEQVKRKSMVHAAIRNAVREKEDRRNAAAARETERTNTEAREAREREIAATRAAEARRSRVAGVSRSRTFANCE